MQEFHLAVVNSRFPWLCRQQAGGLRRYNFIFAHPILCVNSVEIVLDCCWGICSLRPCHFRLVYLISWVAAM